MVNRADETVLITGASTGIGYELARLFAMNGYRLVIVARNEKRLQQLAEKWSGEFDVPVEVIAKDLTDPAAPEEIISLLAKKGITIDILINNAGFGLYGPFTETSFQQELDMIQVNITALTYLTKRLVTGMVSRGKGRILNVASTAAFQPGPLMAVYYATKAYVLSFSEALANELKDKGITVSALCPGPTQTEFGKKANLGQSKLFQGNIMNAQEVATIGYRGMMAGKTVIVPGVKNQILAKSVRFLPRRIVTDIVRKIQEIR
jgi:short-subunit dehydrogenase